jgi:senataxin
MNASVKDVSLDALIEARVSSTARANGKGDTSSDIGRAEQALEKIKQDREALQKELQSVGDNEQKRQALSNDMQKLMRERIEKSRQLDRARDAARDVTRQMDGARREAREAILREADIICGTLAGVGHESLQQYEFDTVIIDEAAQSVEISALIPLKYRCKRCILVGGKSGFCTSCRLALSECVPRSQAIAAHGNIDYRARFRLQSVTLRPNVDAASKRDASSEVSVIMYWLSFR